MAEKNYKVNEAIEITYQAPNKESGLVITAEVILPTDVKDSNFPDQTLTEILSKGIYNGTFTPNVVGEWKVVVHKVGDEGQVVKRYSVGEHNVHAVGEAVGGVSSGVAVVDGKVDTAISGVAAVDGKVDANAAVTDGKVDAVQAKADTIETKVDSIVTSVGALDTPPMIS